MPAPRAETFFHFTKTLDVLMLILRNGFCPRFCLEDVEWQEWTQKHIAYAMTCFCDIPLSRISEHTSFYGKYGIGMTKDWGLRNGLNPVLYFPNSGHLQNLANFLLGLSLGETKPELEEELNANSFNLIKLMKPMHGKMVISGELIEKDFYQESEWRYAPPIDYMLYRKDFDEVLESANSDAEQHAIRFVPSDIRYILVPTDADIPPLCDFINNQMGAFPLNDLKILQTRIVSLETIGADI